jgi:hypothetical protein
MADHPDRRLKEDEMATIRVARRTRFTTIDRETVNDGGLSFRALGLLTWLLDKPDGWTVNAARIAAGEGREGREAIRSTLRELEAAGYLRRERGQDDRGRWRTETVIHERRITDDGFPGVGSPDVGFPGANTKTEQKTETETPAAPPPEDAESARDPVAAHPSAVPSVEVVAAEEEPLARRVVNRYWESCDPKPVTRWIALVKLTERFLDAGWSPRAVLWALGNARAHTIAAMEFALRQVVLPDADRGAAILAAAKHP